MLDCLGLVSEIAEQVNCKTTVSITRQVLQMLFPNNADDCRTIPKNKFLHMKQVLLRLRKHSWSYIKLNNLLILIWGNKSFPKQAGSLFSEFLFQLRIDFSW